MKIGEEEKINAIKLDFDESFENITLEEIAEYLHYLTMEEQEAKGYVWQPYESVKDSLYLGSERTYHDFNMEKARVLLGFFKNKAFLLRSGKYKKSEV